MKMKWTDKYYNIDFKSSSVSEAYNKNGLLVRAHTPDLLHMLTVPPPLKHVHALLSLKTIFVRLKSLLTIYC